MEKRYLEITAVLLFVLLLYLAMKTIFPIFDAVIIAIILAYMIRPISNNLKKRIRFKSLAVAVSMFLVVVPLILLGLYIINEVVFSFKASDLSEIAKASLGNIDELFDNITTRIYSLFGLDFQDAGQQTFDVITNKLAEISASFYVYIFDIAKKIPLVLFKVILAAVLAFYFLRDGEKFGERLVQLVPKPQRKEFSSFVKGTDIVFQAIILGYFFKAICTGIIAICVFYFLGIPNPILLGIVTGILDFIPVIGPWIVEILLFMWYIYQGQYTYAMGVLVLSYFFISFIPEMYIRPRISGKAANLHPAIILIGVMGGLLAFGAIGIVIGPMFLGVVYVVVRIYFYKEPYEEIRFGYRDTFLKLFKRRHKRENNKE
ncbi:MAG: AI-2E family transporter [Candidatus Methanofastidiosia archaeon]